MRDTASARPASSATTRPPTPTRSSSGRREIPGSSRRLRADVPPRLRHRSLRPNAWPARIAAGAIVLRTDDDALLRLAEPRMEDTMAKFLAVYTGVPGARAPGDEATIAK